MRSAPPFLLRLFALSLALALGACESATAPDEGAVVLTEEAVLEAVAAAFPSEEGAGEDRQHRTLRRLLEHALHALTDAKRPGAAHTATEWLRELGQALRAARETGDEAAIREAADAFEMEAARIVVSVLGVEPLKRIAAVTHQGLERVRTFIEKAADASRDVEPLRRAAEGIAEGLSRARSAAETGDHARALVVAARAHDLLGRVRERLGEAAEEEKAPVLPRLVRRALVQVAETDGAEAAEELRERLEALRQDVEEAWKAGDEEAFRDAVVVLESEAARIVVTVLGTEPVDRVLDAGARGLERLARRIKNAEAGGHDVTGPRRILEELTGLHTEALQAAESGDPVTALRLGARVLDALERLRRA